MTRKLLLLPVLCLFVSFSILSCKKYYAEDEKDGSSGDSSGTEESGDYLWNASDLINISLSDNSSTADNSSVTIAGSKITITEPGNYIISGTLSNGQIVVKSADEGVVRIILDNVSITCSNNAPLYIKKATKAILVLSDNSVNTLSGGTSYQTDSDNEPNAALYSKTYLAFYGTGSLAVTSRCLDGICSKDGLVIKNGNISVTAVDDGLRGKDYIVMHDGTLTVTSGGDGIKSDNDSDNSLGYITVENGSLNVTAGGDGISAVTNIKIANGIFDIKTGGGVTAKLGTTEDEGAPPPGGGGTTSGGYTGTVSAKGLKGLASVTIDNGTISINSADDAIHTHNAVLINGGNIDIATGDDGIHAESSIIINGDKVNISKSYEGIESAAITINGGEIYVAATNDGINATKGTVSGGTESNDGSMFTMNSGSLAVTASAGDGIDSNGNLTIAGGTIIVHGPPSQPEVAMDYNGTCNVTGGYFVMSGPYSNMTQGASSSSSQYSFKLVTSSALSASSIFHIQDADGKNIVTFKPDRAYTSVIFSSPDIKSGASYSIYTGGSSTGTNSNGLITGGLYTPGTLKKTFSVSSKITSVTF